MRDCSLFVQFYFWCRLPKHVETTKLTASTILKKSFACSDAILTAFVRFSGASLHLNSCNMYKVTILNFAANSEKIAYIHMAETFY